MSFIYKYKKVYNVEQITDDLILDSLHTSQIRLPAQIIYLLYCFINPSNVIDTLFEHSAYSLFTGIITFYSIVNNSENIILTLFHLLFYATLFGYLEHKIKVYDLSSRFKINWDSNNLFIKLFYNLISDNPVLISLTYKHNIIILSLSLFLLSNHINYELYSLTDIALFILDTMDLLNIVFFLYYNFHLFK